MLKVSVLNYRTNQSKSLSKLLPSKGLNQLVRIRGANQTQFTLLHREFTMQ